MNMFNFFNKKNAAPIVEEGEENFGPYQAGDFVKGDSFGMESRASGDLEEDLKRRLRLYGARELILAAEIKERQLEFADVLASRMATLAAYDAIVGGRVDAESVVAMMDEGELAESLDAISSADR